MRHKEVVLEFRKTKLALELPASYLLEEVMGAAGHLLVLHGYSDHARAVRRRLLGAEPVPGFSVFSPNALFPCPVQQGERFREAYSWYFRDPATGEQLISADFAAEALLRLIRQLGLADGPWVILGFSQGGFFAPHVVRAGLRSRSVITVGAAFRAEAYAGLPPLKVHAIHGENDQVVPYDRAKDSFDVLQKLGYGAEFHPLPGVGHRLDDLGRARVRELLALALRETAER